MIQDFFRKRKLRKALRNTALCASRKLVSDDDLLPGKDKDSLREIASSAKTLASSGSIPEMEKFLAGADGTLERIIAPRAFRTKMRSFLDIIAVAFAVAFGIRALFLQPFQIPTGSMQPTLFGIHYVEKKGLEENCNLFVSKMIRTFSPRAHAVVRKNGMLELFYQPHDSFFSSSADFRIGDETYNLPGDFLRNICRYARLDTEKEYRKGDVLADGYLSTGDHLFVERFTLHFRPLSRGDVIVFNTEDIKSPTQPLSGYYYIKRLVGMPGDTIRFSGNMLEIRPKGENSFRKITEFSDKFKKVYSFEGGYHGHTPEGLLADGNWITVPDDAFFALGDNTTNSLDGRNWGFVPRRNMIGRAFFVFWPFSRRWGIADLPKPLPGKTDLPRSMELQ